MTEHAERKRIDPWLPWFFVLFFVVVLAVNGVMVYFAAASWTGVETRQPYIKGLDYNRTLADVERQKALGWTADLSVTPDAEGARLDLSLADARRLAVAGARVTARLVRPTHEGHDFEIDLEDRGRGRYAGVVRTPLPGQWDVRVSVTHSSGQYRLTRRVVVP
jgi:nitrogen fixation protein FixH